MSKIAIIFPGIGYHTDKPLLYYSKKIAKEYGYRVIEVNYHGFDMNIRGNKEKMQAAFEHAMRQTEEILAAEEVHGLDEIICISKSIGTVVAAAWQKKHDMAAKNIYFTPVEATFSFVRPKSGIVFHGTSDPWIETEIVTHECQKAGLPMYLYKNSNHSLETGVVNTDIVYLLDVIQHCQEYVGHEENKQIGE